MPSKTGKPFILADALVAAFDTNDRINHYLIENLPPEAWHAESPDGKGRDIASIVAHMHNVRRMWLKATGGRIPEKLNPAKATPAQARKALEESRGSIQELLRTSLSADGRIKGFRPDVAGFLGYLIAHDAHHRGQITMLARQSGHPISQKAMFGMWEWGARFSEWNKE